VSDQQNNTTAEVDAATGAVTRRYVDPYGNSRGTAVAWSSAHGFLNAPTSMLSSLKLFGVREYDPSIGKFLSVDAVLDPLIPQLNRPGCVPRVFRGWRLSSRGFRGQRNTLSRLLPGSGSSVRPWPMSARHPTLDL
jgi:hypothetical protein